MFMMDIDAIIEREREKKKRQQTRKKS